MFSTKSGGQYSSNSHVIRTCVLRWNFQERVIQTESVDINFNILGTSINQVREYILVSVVFF